MLGFYMLHCKSSPEAKASRTISTQMLFPQHSPSKKNMVTHGNTSSSHHFPHQFPISHHSPMDLQLSELVRL
jgi:hypothetical protein